MNKLIFTALVSVFAANVALAQTPAVAPAPGATGDNCEAKALSKDGKPLAGTAKATFIKKCEKESKTAEVTSAKTAQQEKMKTCNKEATGKKGDERKKFMSECLKK